MQQLADLQASERGEPSRRIPKIPGAVAHRFKCRTDIAAVLHPYFQIICKTVEEVIDSYSGKKQAFVGGKRATLVGHCKDALKYLAHPSFRLLTGCVAAFKSVADEGYSRFNQDDGFLINVARRWILDFNKEYKTIADSLSRPTKPLFAEYVASAWPGYAKLFGVDYETEEEGVQFFIRVCKDISFKDDIVAFPEELPATLRPALKSVKETIKKCKTRPPVAAPRGGPGFSCVAAFVFKLINLCFYMTK